MGFLERLRLEKEVEAIAAQQEAKRTEEQLNQQRVSAELKRNTDEAEKKLLAERRLQALNFREESGMPKLLRRLCEIDTGLSWWSPEDMNLSLERGIVIDRIFWEAHFKVRPFKETTFSLSGHSYIHHYFDVETRHNGEILFHAEDRLFGRPIVVPETVWRVNEDILEVSLDRAYRHPKKMVHGYSGGEQKRHYFGG